MFINRNSMGGTDREVEIYTNKKEMQLLWYAALAYYNEVQKDLETKYDGNSNWSEEEDGVFLRDLRDQLKAALTTMSNRCYDLKIDIVRSTEFQQSNSPLLHSSYEPLEEKRTSH